MPNQHPAKRSFVDSETMCDAPSGAIAFKTRATNKTKWSRRMKTTNSPVS